MNNKPKKAKITDYLKNKVSYYTLKPVNTPKKVELIVTFKCNLKCPHCDSQKIKSVTELSINQWKTIVTKISNWLGPAFMMVAGGEPLLKEGIFDLLKFISKRNKFGIMTNGQHNKDKIKKLVESNPSYILISLYSLKPEIHDSIRSSPGCHKKTISFIEELIKEKKRLNKNMKINLSFILTSRNFRKAPAFIDYFSKKGVYTSLTVLSTNPLDVFASNSIKYDPFWYKSSDLWIHDIPELKKIMNKIIEQKKNGALINNFESTLKKYVDYYQYPLKPVTSKCYNPILTFTIDPLGDINLCYYSENIGNILEDNPENLWRSLQRRNELKRLKKCKANCRICNNYNFLTLKEKIKFLFE